MRGQVKKREVVHNCKGRHGECSPEVDGYTGDWVRAPAHLPAEYIAAIYSWPEALHSAHRSSRSLGQYMYAPLVASDHLR
jgi:hypothetical protein